MRSVVDEFRANEKAARSWQGSGGYLRWYFRREREDRYRKESERKSNSDEWQLYLLKLWADCRSLYSPWFFEDTTVDPRDANIMARAAAEEFVETPGLKVFFGKKKRAPAVPDEIATGEKVYVDEEPHSVVSDVGDAIQVMRWRDRELRWVDPDAVRMPHAERGETSDQSVPEFSGELVKVERRRWRERFQRDGQFHGLESSNAAGWDRGGDSHVESK